MKLSDIKPQVSTVSDKFSWNFYSWLKKNGMNNRILWDNSDGNPLHPMNIYIINGTVGSVLVSIMRGSKKQFCFSMFPLNEYIDITEDFWKQYLRKGRCMFDVAHRTWWDGGGDRYTMINKNSKRCKWCGRILTRKIEKHTEMTMIEHWV